MAFRDFTFPQVKDVFKLSYLDADMFSNVEPIVLPDWFRELVRGGTVLAYANNTEKAKSEFIIAPILFEIRRESNDSFSLFSGVEWNVDAALGLNGYCDYILAKGPTRLALSAPYIAIVEAKNDVIQNGLGQCIAAMYAASYMNKKENTPIKVVHGVVTTGAIWKFLRLSDDVITLDIPDYLISDLPKIMGILKHIVLSVQL